MKIGRISDDRNPSVELMPDGRVVFQFWSVENFHGTLAELAVAILDWLKEQAMLPRDAHDFSLSPTYVPLEEAEMTRTQFIRAWAERSGFSHEWAELGFVEIGGSEKRFALPCGCGEKECEGWAMVSAESALDHLFFRAPDSLIDAYRGAVEKSGGA